MRGAGKVSVMVAAAALVLTSCGSDGDGGGSAGEGNGGGTGCEGAEGDGPNIGVAYDVGGRGDQSFNDSAFAGIQKAIDELDATCTEVEAGSGESDADREERLRLLAESDHNPVLAIGFVYSPAVAKVAEEYPDVDFAVVDGFATFITGEEVVIDNVADLNFAEQEGSFLVGVAAALKTETGVVGFVGGVNGPLIKKFEAGFKAGVKAADPDVRVLTEYLSQGDPVQGFENPAGGETAARGMLGDRRNPADVIYHAAGKSGLGVFDAVQAAGEGNWAIGVDSDQYLTVDEDQQPFILTSMLKRIDVAVFEYVSAFAEGEAPNGVALYDLSVDGVGYSTSGGHVDDITDQLDDYAEQIKSGEIEVPTEP